MTKKDYELIAQWVKDYTHVKENGERAFYSGGLLALGLRLHKDNAKFDYERFLKACGDTAVTKD